MDEDSLGFRVSCHTAENGSTLQQHSLSSHWVLGPVLGAGDTLRKKTQSLEELTVYQGKETSSQKNNTI